MFEPRAGAPGRSGLWGRGALVRLRGIMATTALLAAACSPSAPSTRAPVSLGLADGSPLASLLPSSPQDTSFVLVYDPSDCFSCDGELAQWLSMRAQRNWSIRLVLTREPTPSEMTQLHLFRLAASGYVHPSAKRLGTPRVYRYHGHVLVDSAVGRPGQATILARGISGHAGTAPSTEGGPPRSSQPSTYGQ